MKVNMSFSGGQQLVKALGALPAAVSMKAQRNALRAGAEPIRAAAAQMAPRGPDAPHIADNIVIGIPTSALADVRDEDAVVAVGPQKDYFYGFFWEFGTIKHGAHPFMRPAFDTKAPAALVIIGQQLWAEIRKATERIFAQQSNTTGANRGRSTGVGL